MNEPWVNDLLTERFQRMIALSPDVIVVDWHGYYLTGYGLRRPSIRKARKFMESEFFEWARENARVFEILEIDHITRKDEEYHKTGQSANDPLASSGVPTEIVTDRFFKIGQSPTETYSADGRTMYSTGKFRKWLKTNSVSTNVLVVGLFLDQCMFQTVSALAALGHRSIVIRDGCVPTLRMSRRRSSVEGMLTQIRGTAGDPVVVNWDGSDVTGLI